MHVAMLRRTVLTRDDVSGNNPSFQGRTAHSIRDNSPIIVGLVAMVLMIIAASAGHSGEIELRDDVKAMHTCSWSTGATDSVNEGVTAVETLSATSDSSGTCTYSIVGGVDSSDFSISGAALSFAATPDYESPADSDSDNEYVVQVRATDSADSANTDLTITVTVNDLTLAIASGQSFALSETASNGDAIGTVTLSADTAVAWSLLSNGADADGDGTSPFSISSSGVISLADSGDINYETTTSYTLSVLGTNFDESDIESVTITVTNIAPTITDDDTGTVSEIAANGATVVDLDNTGDDDSITWSITAGNLDPDSDDNKVFAINAATGVITVNDADDLDYETTTSYSLTVRVTDGTTNSDETITVTVTNVAPALTDDDTGTVSETATASTAVIDIDNTGDDDIT
ncbi:MAG: cadherin repeat domain-containing protein, partial [Euryarchaeota archaeon TMED192]